MAGPERTATNERRGREVSLWLTDGCNLRCKYCFQSPVRGSHHNPTYIESATIERFLLFCQAQGYNRIHLFGGEPLLARNQLFYLVRRSREFLTRPAFELVTNGTLIDAEVMALIEENSIGVLLSLDGDRDSHDKYRGGFTKIERWLRRLSAIPDICVALQVSEVSGLWNRVHYVWEQGIASVAVNIVENYEWYQPNDVQIFEEEYEQCVLDMLTGKGVLVDALYSLRVQQCSTYRRGCGATWHDVACSVDGLLYPCHRFPEIGPAFSVGNVVDGLDKEKTEALREKLDSAINHHAYPYIDSEYCPVSLFLVKGSFEALPPVTYCELVETKHKLVAKYYHQLKAFEQLQESTQSMPP